MANTPPQCGDLRECDRWREDGWTVRIVRDAGNSDWVAEIGRSEDTEPVLVVPWSTGPEHDAPLALDARTFASLVRAATTELERHERQLHALLHKRVALSAAGGQWQVELEIVPDEYDPHALLRAFDSAGECVANARVAPDFRLDTASARRWITDDFRITVPAGGRYAE